jgi:hypothetical protein
MKTFPLSSTTPGLLIGEQLYRIALTAIVIVRWSKDLDVIFSMFEVSSSSGQFLAKKESQRNPTS